MKMGKMCNEITSTKILANILGVLLHYIKYICDKGNIKDTESDPAQPYVTVKIRVSYSVRKLNNWCETSLKVNLSN
jgi:hypothetical protein